MRVDLAVSLCLIESFSFYIHYSFFFFQDAFRALKSVFAYHMHAHRADVCSHAFGNQRAI